MPTAGLGGGAARTLNCIVSFAEEGTGELFCIRLGMRNTCLMVVMMVRIVTAVRGGGAARMRDRIASNCRWGRREALVHKSGHAGHLLEAAMRTL